MRTEIQHWHSQSLVTIMPNQKQINVFVDDGSSDSSSNRCGWFLDYSSARGIHVKSSSLLRRGGAKTVIPNSIDLQKYHHPSSERSVGRWQFRWLVLIDTIVDWIFGYHDSSWVAPVRSQFRAIDVKILVLFSDIMFSINSKNIFLGCFLREDQIW